jgi:hypothetical protein
MAVLFPKKSRMLRKGLKARHPKKRGAFPPDDGVSWARTIRAPVGVWVRSENGSPLVAGACVATSRRLRATPACHVLPPERNEGFQGLRSAPA